MVKRVVTAYLGALCLMFGATEATAAGAPDDPLGVVRVVRGSVGLAPLGAAAEVAATGVLVYPGTSIESEADGWAEVFLVSDVRVRISARTRLIIERNDQGLQLSLLSGRLWVQTTGARDSRQIDVSALGLDVTIDPSSSVVVESSNATGTLVAVRAGRAEVIARTGSEDLTAVEVLEGQLVRDRGLRGAREATVGGTTLWALAAREARSGLGDLAGVEAFLIGRTLSVVLAPTDLRRIRQILTADPELFRGPYADRLLEGSLRPAPFLESEIPDPGSNIEVEVRFEE